MVGKHCSSPPKYFCNITSKTTVSFVNVVHFGWSICLGKLEVGNPSRDIISLSEITSTGGFNLEHLWHILFLISTMLNNYFMYFNPSVQTGVKGVNWISEKIIARSKKQEKADEHEADPITFPLYQEICKTAIKMGNEILWCFTVLQWNYMSRSINISNLRFNSFSIGKDSIDVKYWETKKYTTGEKNTPKNCYANPNNYFVCFNTALAVYLIIMDETFRDGRKTLFLSPKAQDSSALHKYCSQAKELFKKVIPEKVAL